MIKSLRVDFYLTRIFPVAALIFSLFLVNPPRLMGGPGKPPGEPPDELLGQRMVNPPRLMGGPGKPPGEPPDKLLGQRIDGPILVVREQFSAPIVEVGLRKDSEQPSLFPIKFVQTKKALLGWNDRGEKILTALLDSRLKGLIGYDAKSYLLMRGDGQQETSLSLFHEGEKNFLEKRGFALNRRFPSIVLFDQGHLCIVSIAERSIDFFDDQGAILHHYPLADLRSCDQTVSGNGEWILSRISTSCGHQPASRFLYFSKDGQLKMEFPAKSGLAQGFVSFTGERIAILTEGALLALKPEGTVSWQKELNPSRRRGALSPDGGLIALYDEVLQEVTMLNYNTGEILWQKKLDKKLLPMISQVTSLDFLERDLLITMQQDQPVVNNLCHAYLLDQHGSLLWNKEYQVSSIEARTAPANGSFAIMAGRSLEVYHLKTAQSPEKIILR